MGISTLARDQFTILIVDQTLVTIFGVGFSSVDLLIAGLSVTKPCVVFVLVHGFSSVDLLIAGLSVTKPCVVFYLPMT